MLRWMVGELMWLWNTGCKNVGTNQIFNCNVLFYIYIFGLLAPLYYSVKAYFTANFLHVILYIKYSFFLICFSSVFEFCKFIFENNYWNLSMSVVSYHSSSYSFQYLTNFWTECLWNILLYLQMRILISVQRTYIWKWS